MKKPVTDISFEERTRSLWISQKTKGAGYEWNYIGRLITPDENKSEVLIHAFLYCLQTRQKIPYRNNWNAKFFQNSFKGLQRAQLDLVTLSIIIKGIKEGRLVKLAENDNEDNSRIFGIRNIVGGELVYPVIMNKKNLSYRNRSRSCVLSLDYDDVSLLFTQLLNKMSSGNRNEREHLGIIYSYFPFEAYEQAFLIR